MWRADANRTAVTGVGTFGSLADDHEINFARVLQRGLDTREELGRTQVNVVIQREAHLQQQSAFENARRNVRRVTDGTEQNSVVLAQGVKVDVGEQFAIAQVATRTEVILGGVELADSSPQHLQCLCRNFCADAITRDDGDLQLSYLSHFLRYPSHYMDTNECSRT